MMFKIGLIFCCWSSLIYISVAETVYEAISRNQRLSQFKEWVNNDQVLKVYLEHRSATVFAPSNQAIANYRKSMGEDIARKIASYHVVHFVAQKELFPNSVSSTLQEAAPLYLSYWEQRPPKYSTENIHRNPNRDYYVNNAKIGENDAYDYYSKSGDRQLLYIIDEVLEPYIPTARLPPLALELIRQPSVYKIDESLGPFANKIASAKMESMFERPGNHTFFVPVGDLNRPGHEIDKYVIQGHVIPNQVLFLRVMGKEHYYSAAYDGIVNAELSLFNRTIRLDSEQSFYIQSNTIKTKDPKHNKGVVMSRIVKANIPVKNGVVHLIEKPLMIIDISIADFLGLEQGRLSIFNRLLNSAPDVRGEINSLKQKTILAPTDEAFNSLNEGPDDNKVEQLMNNLTELSRLLRLHIVQQSVSTDEIRNAIIKDFVSSDGQRNLYFRVVGDEKTPKLTIKGGGVNATAVQADIGATNGIIHIIDRVLGMQILKFQNLLDKLNQDSTLSFSRLLGTQGNQNWNQQFASENLNFTYFVPSDSAWDQFNIQNPSEYKQLKSGQYAYLAKHILERHLVVNKQYSSFELKNSTIDTVMGQIEIVRKGESLQVKWEDKVANITRPDVQAINGVIHVIDRVLVKKRDLIVSASSTQVASISLTIIASIFAMFYH